MTTLNHRIHDMLRHLDDLTVNRRACVSRERRDVVERWRRRS